MMILRVYAMWNQSKQILYALLVIYVPQIMVALILTAIYDNPNKYLQGMYSPKMQLNTNLMQVVIHCTLSSSHNCASH